MKILQAYKIVKTIEKSNAKIRFLEGAYSEQYILDDANHLVIATKLGPVAGSQLIYTASTKAAQPCNDTDFHGRNARIIFDALRKKMCQNNQNRTR